MRGKIGWFLSLENGIKRTGTGIWSLVILEKYQKLKLGMEFEHCEVGFRENMRKKSIRYTLPLSISEEYIAVNLGSSVP